MFLSKRKEPAKPDSSGNGEEWDRYYHVPFPDVKVDYGIDVIDLNSINNFEPISIGFNLEDQYPWLREYEAEEEHDDTPHAVVFEPIKMGF